MHHSSGHFSEGSNGGSKTDKNKCLISYTLIVWTSSPAKVKQLSGGYLISSNIRLHFRSFLDQCIPVKKKKKKKKVHHERWCSKKVLVF